MFAQRLFVLFLLALCRCDDSDVDFDNDFFPSPDSSGGSHAAEHAVKKEEASAEGNPFVESIAPTVGPTEGGNVITITGRNFGEHDRNLEVKIGGSVCKNLVLTTSTQILCEAPPGAGTQLPLVVSLFEKGVAHRNPLTDTPHYAYFAPLVTAAVPHNGPIIGETVITIQGKYFGYVDSKPVAKIGGKQCLDTTWFSDQKIRCVTPKGMGLGDIRVFVDGQGSKEGLGAVFQYDAPTISGVSPDHGRTTGPTRITISGSNFGISNGHPQASVGGAVCESPEWVSDSSIICEVSGGSGSRHVIVTVLGEKSVPSPHSLFTFDGPMVTGLSELNGPAAGATQITIFGTNFGHEKSQIIAEIGGHRCTATHWVSDSSARCLTPTGLGAGNQITVKVPNTESQPSPVGLHFSYDAPSITSIAPLRGPTTGSFQLTIFGDNFGAHFNNIIAHVGRTNCPESKWVSNTEGICSMPAGSGSDLQVRVLVQGLKSPPRNPDAIFAYALPTIEELRPSEGKPSGGQLVTVIGSNFGDEKSAVSARFGSSGCTVLHVRDDQIVVATTPQQGTQTLFVTVNGQTSKSSVAFKFSGPHVYKLSIGHGPTVGGTTVTVVGSDLGSGDGMSIQIGDMQCLDTEYVSSTSAMCVTPPGVGGANIVSVFSAGNLVAKSGPKALFSYDAPVVKQLAPSQGSASGGTKVLIMGRNFGFVDSGPTIRVGGTRCLESRWSSDEGAVCYTPPATPGTNTVAVTVEVDGQKSVSTNSVGMFHYDAIPTKVKIHSVTPLHAPPSGGAVLEVRGEGFEKSSADAPLDIKIGNTDCDVSTWVSETVVSCVVAPGVGGNRVVIIEMGGSVVSSSAQDNLFFSYDGPEVVSVKPSEGPMEGGIAVTISGRYFGPSGENLEAFIGVSACSGVEWVSESVLTCSAPAGEGSEQIVSVKVGHQKSVRGSFTTDGTYNFEGLTVDRVSPAHIPTTGQQIITLHAASFGAHSAFEKGATVLVKGLPCENVLWLSPEAISCKIGPGVGGGLDVKVKIDSELWRGYGVLSYDAPWVFDVVPSHGPLFGGVPLTIIGKNFGLSDDEPVAYVSGNKCLTTLFVSDSELTCILPPYKGRGSNASAVAVAVANQFSPKNHLGHVVYDPPVVSGAFPELAPVMGQSVITIIGRDFGPTDLGPMAFVDGSPCVSTQWWSDDMVTCVVPKGSDLYVAHFLTVQVLNHTSVLNPSANFSYADMRGWPDRDAEEETHPASTQGQRGSIFLTIAYVVPALFILASIVCGSCLFSSQSPDSNNFPRHRTAGGIMARIKSQLSRGMTKIKKIIFKTSGVYSGENTMNNDRWGHDYNSLVESIEMEISSEIGHDDDINAL